MCIGLFEKRKCVKLPCISWGLRQNCLGRHQQKNHQHLLCQQPWPALPSLYHEIPGDKNLWIIITNPKEVLVMVSTVDQINTKKRSPNLSVISAAICSFCYKQKLNVWVEKFFQHHLVIITVIAFSQECDFIFTYLMVSNRESRSSAQ